MYKIVSSLLKVFFFLGIIAVAVVVTILWRMSQTLPDYRQLEIYEPAVTTRLYAGDGQLLIEYATEKRLFVPIEKVPDIVKQAFISAEDKRFYAHSGVDYMGVLRALLTNLKNSGSNRRLVGASTITQQVAKNFLLTSERSYVRKIKEALLSWRMERAFSKNHILELYLNEIYLGNRSYGVAAAALNYFNKSLDELTIEEAAYLAALPKGPNNYNPKTKYEAAIDRRNWVIGRMFEDGYVNEEEAETAKTQPLEVVERKDMFIKNASYFSEEVRRKVEEMFGKDAINEGGLMVRTTVDPKLQQIATNAFRKELINYDRRHGYRGAITNIDFDEETYVEQLKKIEAPDGAEENWQMAVVVDVKDDLVVLKTIEAEDGVIPLSVLYWARKQLENQEIGDRIKSAHEVAKIGDVILVEKVSQEKIIEQKLPINTYHLRQVPNVNGGMIAIDPHTGRVLAIVGGFSYNVSQYNRATQARRQTGSAFKPFVYLSALENNYSPTDLILDAPFILSQGKGMPKWKPKNYSNRFYGLMTLREGVEKSRNLMTVRLAQELGMEEVSRFAEHMGINDNLPKFLSMSLGAGDTRLIDIASAYATIVNGGKKVTPYFIEKIQDRDGLTIYRNDTRACQDCNFDLWDSQNLPNIEDNREQLIDEMSAYQMTSILEGVVTRGTGARLRGIKKHLGGKTGTTNDNKDAWFIGFSPDLVVGAYVGFDSPRSLGKFETGAKAALPVFYSFMEEALKNQPDIPFRIPAGMKLVRISYKTGRAAVPGDAQVIIEALKPDFDFDKNAQRVVEGVSDEEELVVDENSKFGDYKNSGIDNSFQLGTQY